MENDKKIIINKIILTLIIILIIISISITSRAELIETRINDNEVYLTDSSGTTAYDKIYDKIQTYMLDIQNMERDTTRYPGITYTEDPYEGAITGTVKGKYGQDRFMPTYKLYENRGLVPQYYINMNYRYGYLDKSRWDLSTTEWGSFFGGGVVYCANFHSPIRMSQYDTKRYYISTVEAVKFLNSGKVEINGSSINSEMRTICKMIKEKFNEASDKDKQGHGSNYKYYTNEGEKDDDSTAYCKVNGINGGDGVSIEFKITGTEGASYDDLALFDYATASGKIYSWIIDNAIDSGLVSDGPAAT